MSSCGAGTSLLSPEARSTGTSTIGLEDDEAGASGSKAFGLAQNENEESHESQNGQKSHEATTRWPEDPPRN